MAQDIFIGITRQEWNRICKQLGLRCSSCDENIVSYREEDFKVYQDGKGVLFCHFCFHDARRIGRKMYRNRVAEELALSLPGPCRNYLKHGCPEDFLQPNEVASHEKNCKFRPVDCPVHADSDCDKSASLTFENVFDHVSAWSFNETLSMGSYDFVFKSYVDEEFNRQPGSSRLLYGGVYNWKESECFIDMCFSSRHNPENWYFWVYYLGSKEEAERYEYTFKFEREGPKKNLKLELFGPVISIDVTKNEAIALETITFLPEAMIRAMFWNKKDDSLQYKMFIREVKKQTFGSIFQTKSED